jgi:hypothetical protein
MPTAWGFVGYRARDLRAVISDHSVIGAERSYETIQCPARATRDCFTSPAMTGMSRRQLRRMGTIAMLPRAH